MTELELNRPVEPVVAEVGGALRRTRRQLGLSQREFAELIGVSKSRLGRLESDAGAQSLVMVCQVLKASGFRLEVIDASDNGLASDTEPQGADAQAANIILELRDASGRRFPAHLDAHRLLYPPLYWFLRNGGWLTSQEFPRWTYERRFVPRAQTQNRVRNDDGSDDPPD